MLLKTITTHQVFVNTKASTLFELYTDAQKHAEVTGAPALITDHLGDPFNLYGGFCFGENLEIKKDKLILQTWRTEDWPHEMDDSILIMRLMQIGSDAHVYLTHADLPATVAEEMLKGWDQFYWTKWRTYIDMEQRLTD